MNLTRLRMLRRGALAGLLALAALPLAMPAAAADAIDASTPQKLIETSSKVLFADLDANRAKYRKDITQLYKVVDTLFLPHVDVDYAAQQVLAKHWRTVGSSRVDLQACKLEYSIVSPK